MNLYKMEKEGYNVAINLIEKYLGKEILEVGCGYSQLMRKISDKHGINVICIDPYASGKNIIRMKGEDISMLNKNFDVIYSVMSFHHIENVKKFLEGAKKSLKHDGKLIIVDWKKGIYTGVPEYYYSLDEVIEIMKEYKIIEANEEKYHFYIVSSLAWEDVDYKT